LRDCLGAEQRARGGHRSPRSHCWLAALLAPLLAALLSALLAALLLNRCEQQGRGRKVTRSIGSGYGYGYGYDGQMSDPQGMPLTGNAPWGWGTTEHAANRHCPLE
jgi:hypothetical protein